MGAEDCTECSGIKAEQGQNKGEHKILRENDNKLFDLIGQLSQNMIEFVAGRPRPEDLETIRLQASKNGVLTGIVYGTLGSAFILAIAIMVIKIFLKI